MDVLQALVIALSGLWLFLPAMLPNSAAVIFGGGRPVDFGRTWKGERLLGDGKTWNGFLGGAGAGIVLGILQIGLAYLFDPADLWGFVDLATGVSVVIALSFGSLIGDMLGSFLKRRLGIARGMKAPVLDQYDFLIGAFLVTTALFPTWVYDSYVDGTHLLALLFLLVITPILHRTVNIIGYRMGKKDVPW